MVEIEIQIPTEKMTRYGPLEFIKYESSDVAVNCRFCIAVINNYSVYQLLYLGYYWQLEFCDEICLNCFILSKPAKLFARSI